MDTLDLSRDKISSFGVLQHLGKLTDLWVRVVAAAINHFFVYVEALCCSRGRVRINVNASHFWVEAQ